MAFVGLRYAVFAPIETETPGAPITYGKGVVMGKMIGATINFTRNSDPLYADDAMAENDNSIVGGTLQVNVDDLLDEAATVVLGLVKQAPEGETGPTVYRETGESSPYGGVGYLRVRRKANKTSYVAYWLHKVMLGIASESANTKAQTITWQTPTLDGTILGAQIATDGKNYFRDHAEFTTAQAALAWINERANITTATGG